MWGISYTHTMPEIYFLWYSSHFGSYTISISVQDKDLADLCSSPCCHWLQAANNEVGGLSEQYQDTKMVSRNFVISQVKDAAAADNLREM
jgi:hypothetical protein